MFNILLQLKPARIQKKWQCVEARAARRGRCMKIRKKASNLIYKQFSLLKVKIPLSIMF